MRPSIIVLACLAVLALSGTATGYLISFDAPSWVALGEPIPVTGTSTYPSGAQGSVIAYRAMPGNLPVSVDYQVFTTAPDGAWKVSFDTDGWMATSYKLEIAKNDNYPLGSSSVTYKYVDVIDRSQDCVVTTPDTQYWEGDITISGIAHSPVGGRILITITDASGTDLSGTIPVSVATDGTFSLRYAVPGPGTYTVRYADEKGPLTEQDVTVILHPDATPVPTVTPVPPAVGTPAPTPTTTPLPLAGLLAGMLGAGYAFSQRRGREP